MKINETKCKDIFIVSRDSGLEIGTIMLLCDKWVFTVDNPVHSFTLDDLFVISSFIAKKGGKYEVLLSDSGSNKLYITDK